MLEKTKTRGKRRVDAMYVQTTRDFCEKGFARDHHKGVNDKTQPKPRKSQRKLSLSLRKVYVYLKKTIGKCRFAGPVRRAENPASAFRLN